MLKAEVHSIKSEKPTSAALVLESIKNVHTFFLETQKVLQMRSGEKKKKNSLRNLDLH